MVRAVATARFGMLVRREIAALALAFSDDHVGKVELRRAANSEVLLQAVRDPRIDIEVRDGLGDRIERVGRIISRAEQPLLLTGHRQKHDRPIGPWTLGKYVRL